MVTNIAGGKEADLPASGKSSDETTAAAPDNLTTASRQALSQNRATSLLPDF